MVLQLRREAKNTRCKASVRSRRRQLTQYAFLQCHKPRGGHGWLQGRLCSCFPYGAIIVRFTHSILFKLTQFGKKQERKKNKTRMFEDEYDQRKSANARQYMNKSRVNNHCKHHGCSCCEFFGKYMKRAFAHRYRTETRSMMVHDADQLSFVKINRNSRSSNLF